VEFQVAQADAQIRLHQRAKDLTGVPREVTPKLTYILKMWFSTESAVYLL